MTWASKRYDAVNWHGAPWMGIISSEYPSAALVPRRTTVSRINTETSMVAEDGTVRISDVAAKAAYRLRLEHPYITLAQLQYLRLYFDAWGNTKVRVYDAEGRVFDCAMPRELDSVQSVSAVYFTASLQLEGNLGA
jgi:hypothetical protein